MDWIWIWVAIVALSLVVEFVTMEMVSLWTAIGGLVALLLSALDVSIEIQLIVFFVVSIALLLSLRKVALKFLLKNNLKSGSNSMIGTIHKIENPITENSLGTIKINGVIWSATTSDGTELPAGTLVEIIEVKGNKLIVKLKEK